MTGVLHRKAGKALSGPATRTIEDLSACTVGASFVETTAGTTCLRHAPANGTMYTNAQLDDYQGVPRADFSWRAPVSLHLRARFSHAAGDLKGTAGFGFWNDPFMMSGTRSPALPRALWFFYASPPSDMKLARDVPGQGWKAATIDAQRPLFYLLAPTAPLGFWLMHYAPLYRVLWPLAQRSLGVAEAVLPVSMTAWHTYGIEWTSDVARFSVDGRTVLVNPEPPRGRLAFVMWLDNQYAIVTPQGRFGWGLLGSAETQWMEVEGLRIR